MYIPRLAVFSAAAALLFTPVSVSHASDKGTFSATLGAAASFSPDYEGSDDYGVGGIPFLSLGWQTKPDVPSGGSGLQFGLHDAKLNIPGSLEVGIVKLYRPEGVYAGNIGVAFSGGRDQDDNDALLGMGDIDMHALGSAGINFEAANSGWRLGINYTHAISSEDYGSVLSGQIGYAKSITDTLTITPVVHTSWADSDHMQSYFGVSSQQASQSGNQQFDTESGIKSVGVGVGLGWAFRDGWMLNTGLDYTRLTNDAADSPLVEDQGSVDQFETSIALIYMF